MKEESDRQRIIEILEDVLAIEPEDRQKYLESAGFDDTTLQEIESLLAFEKEAESAMTLSAVEFSKDFFDDDGDRDLLVGQEIGPYKIVSELGYGGMGAVYLAERADGEFSKKVALKLIKREMNTAAFRRRFQNEREILASLGHPNIARLLDAGTTADRIPYLILEYVEGVPIDVFCRTRNPDLDQRLELFKKICSAVDFAHRNLIVHRDLKPSNILITEDGNPKLLDFGISKIFSSDVSALNAATITEMGVMTPSYASPEQLQRKSVTTATDVYSLGIILYKILSGHRPFERRDDDLGEIYRAVIESEPTTPSEMMETSLRNIKEITRAETVVMHDENRANETKRSSSPATNPGNHQRTESAKSKIRSQTLKGDLDNIILKALKKEPERRYASVENFAADIRRHQVGLPVSARPDTLSYRLERFYARNKAGAIGAGLVMLAIFAGVVATVWQARVAQAERAKAEKRFNEVRSLANSNLFDIYPEIENLEGSLKAREKILTNALQYLDSLANEATGDLSLQSELATAYEKVGDVQGALSNSNLGNVQAGLDSYAKAARLREAVYAANPSDLEAKEKLANNYYTTARTLWNNSQTAEADEAFQRALTLRRELVRDLPASADHQNRLAVLLIDYGAIPVFNSQSEKAIVLFDEAFAIIEKLRAGDPENGDFKKAQTRLLRSMSKAKGSLGDYEGAVRGFDLAIAISDDLARQFPNDFRVQRSVWLTNTMKCELFIEKKDGRQAVETCTPTTAFPENALAKEPENGVVAYDLAISYFNVARAHRLAENFAATIESTTKASAVMSRLSGKNPDNVEYRRNLAIYDTERARALIALKRYTDALAPLASVIRIMEPITEADNESLTYRYDLSIAHRLLAQAQFETSQREKAVDSIEKAIAIVQQLTEKDAIRESDKDLLKELISERAEYTGK